MKAFFLLFLFTGIAQAGPESLYPNPTLTPGETNPDLNKDVICAEGFRTGKYRKVTSEMKKEVFQRQNIPWSEHFKYEVDHWWPICLAGQNSLKNLWAMPYINIINEENMGARQKDFVEVNLYHELCHNQVTLDRAHEIINTDWMGCYHTLKSGVKCH